LSLILIDFYFKGGRVVLLNYKIAAGVFEQDRYLSIIQGGVNLVISIIGAKYIGLAGVYIGTVISGVMANLIRPVIIYRDCFSRSAWAYFKDSLKYICTILGILLILMPVKNFLLVRVNLFTFLLMAGIITIVYNLIFMCFFRKTEEFAYLLSVVGRKFRRKNG
ncbi:MAG: polysaccharide biosynthesis protein, partial [Lachnospiraceae bacterium]|nr:polysaccharide biosynthesis protein [Lachnospiraceae bacterium]